MALVGEPKFSIKATLDSDGNLAVKAYATATYGERSATVVEDVDTLNQTGLLGALAVLLESQKADLGRQVEMAAYEAAVRAQRNGEAF